MDRETNEERQENELQFLQEVYGAKDLRADDPWKVRINIYVVRSNRHNCLYYIYLLVEGIT